MPEVTVCPSVHVHLFWHYLQEPHRCPQLQLPPSPWLVGSVQTNIMFLLCPQMQTPGCISVFLNKRVDDDTMFAIIPHVCKRNEPW